MALMNDQSFSIHDKIPICELNSDQLSTYDGYYKQSKSFRDVIWFRSHLPLTSLIKTAPRVWLE